MRPLYFFMTALIMASACVERGNNEENNNISTETNSEEANEIKDNNEFDKAFTTSPYFSKWDANSDGHIDQREFYDDYFAMTDKNQDGVLNQEEWEKSISTHFGTNGEEKYGEFAEWDANSDKQVQAEEFQQYLEENRYFGEWDENGDGQLQEPEFAEETFARWDTDGNGVIEADEYAEFDQKVGEF